MRLEDETRTIPKMTDIPSRPIPGTWRRKTYHATSNNTSKFRRRATSQILQKYGETKMTKLSSRPASLCHPNESATLADTNLRDLNHSREESPGRNIAHCGWCSQQQGATSVIPKIRISVGNPKLYPGCPLTTTDRTQKTKAFSTTLTKTKSIDPHNKTCHFRPAQKNHVNFDPPHKDQVDFDPNTTSNQFGPLTQKLSFFRPQHWSQVNFDPQFKIISI